MAGLRDLLNAPDRNLSGDQLEQISANNMGSLRRGWGSGRLGNSANYKLAEEAALRASATPQDLTRAATLRGEIEQLQRKQGIYAPEVGRVEDIDGVGSGLTWLGGQVGQGAASMTDPIVASTLSAGAGNLIGAIPHPVAKAVGLGLRTVGAYGLPYAINQRQLKGEFYGDARQDQALMANHTPQEINDAANQYGALAAIPDSAIPGLVGRKLGLTGLRAGGQRVPGLGRVAGELVGEGTTELGQEAGKQFALGQLNPERDTSGDFSANLNAFAGGVAGAGSPVVAGHVVDTAARRVAGGAQAVKETAGKVIDMAAPHVQPLMDKAVTAGKAVRGGVIDLAEAAKGAYEEKGLGGLKDELKAAGQAARSRWTMNSEERDLLAGMPPPEFDPSTNPEGFAAWHAENGPKRVQAIMDRLDDRFGEGDEQAGALGDKLAGAQDPIAQGAAADEAAQYLMDNTELEQLGRRAERFSEAAGEVAGKAGAAAGKALGAAGRLAARFGKAAIQGVKNSKPAEGEGSKKNAQSWTQEQYDAETAKRKAAADDILGRAKLMGQYLSKSSETSQQMQGLAPKQRSAIAGLLKDLGYEISDLSDLANSQQTQAAKPTGKAKQGSGLNRQTVSGDALTTGVNRVVNNLRAAYGRQTPEVLKNLRAMAPHASKLFDAMDAELETQMQDRSGTYTASVRAAAAENILKELPREIEAQLLAEDINVRSPEAKRKILGMVEAVALGRVPPAARGRLERLLGKDTVQRMAALLAPDVSPEQAEQLLSSHEVAGEGYAVSDDGEVGEPASSKFGQEGAEKKVARGTGTTIYGFHATKEPRSNATAYGRERDPFDYTTKMSKDELAEFRKANLARQAVGEDPLPDPRKRPSLFKPGQTLHDGSDAVGKKIADIQKYLKVDQTPERMATMLEEEDKKAAAQKVRQAMAEKDNEKAQAWLAEMVPAFFETRAGGWNVTTKSAADVMGTPDTSRLLTLFRDYLRQDGDDVRAGTVQRALLDALDQKRGADTELRLTAGQRRKILDAAKAYFAEHQIVVAERLSDQDPLSIDEAQLLDMAKQGARVVELARKDGGNKRIDEANLLTFKAMEGGQLLHVPVSRLADLARQAREQSEAFDAENTRGGQQTDQQYLRDVMTGVSVLLGSGLVQGLPFKMNARGEREQMSAKGLPPSLRLLDKTVGAMEWGKKKRAEEQRPDPKHNPYGMETSELLERDEVSPLLADETVEDETPLDTRTQLDAQPKPKGGKSETGQLDEFADQRTRSLAQGFDPAKGISREYRIDAVKKAKERGDALRAQIERDFDAGMAVAERRLRVAKAVARSGDPNAPVGGPHYAAPLAYALSEDAITQMDLSPEQAKRALALQAEALAVIGGEKNFKPADRKALLDEMVPSRKDEAASVKEAEAPAGKSQSLPAGAAEGRPNAQSSASGQPSTMAERAEAINYIKKVLGPQVKTQFEDITGYSGEWIEAENVIKISTTSAAGTMQTAYHEALHAFFSRFVAKNPQARDVLKAIGDNPRLLARLEALLRDYPNAQAQLADGEERLAYAYQFWAAGKLELPHAKARNLFQKLAKFFRQVLGRVTDSERATAVFEALHAGEFGGELSDAGKALQKLLDRGTWTPRAIRKMDGLTQKIAALVLPANTILEKSASPAAQRLARMFWTNPGQAEAGSAREGYLNARARHGARFVNLALAELQDLNERDLKEVMAKLQEEKDNLHEIAYAPAREAAEKLRALLQRFRVYMVDERGMDIGDRGPFYFPRTWNPDAVASDMDGFVKLMTSKYADMLSGDNSAEKDAAAKRLARALVDGDVIDGKKAVQRDDGVLSPFFSQGEERVLAWMKGEDIQKYLRKDLVGTLTNYFHNGARAAEYTARFGQDGEGLANILGVVEKDLRDEAKRLVERGDLKGQAAGKKWAERQIRDVRDAVAAMEGSIGKDGSMTMRKVNSWVTVYQNVRLLPVALFAQVADTMGVIARGGTVSDAYESFLRGMKEVASSWADLFRDEPKERRADKWEKLALAVGTVDAAMFSHHVSEEYSSTFMNSTARKVNDTFFRLNGMEAWNRGMRVGATKSAAQFLERHKSLPNEHSARWLQELGLKPRDIILNADGELVTHWRERMALTGESETTARENNERIHYALNRWVQGAVLTPNAAMRPAWSSDPSYSMFFHLKQFSYAFHQTILKRAVKEMDHGNMAPMGSFLWYVPVMIATDIVKGLALNGGELPAHMKGMNVGDWMMHGAERTGMLGVGAIGVDAQHDIASLGGPAVEQVIDAFKDDFGATTLNALPANPLYKNLVKA